MNFNWTDDKTIQDNWKERYANVSTKSTPTNPNYNEIISRYVKKAISDAKTLINESDADSRDKLDELFNKIELDINREVGEINLSEIDIKDEYDRNDNQNQSKLNDEINDNTEYDNRFINQFNRKTNYSKTQLSNEHSFEELSFHLENAIEVGRLDRIKQLSDTEKASVKKIYDTLLYNQAWSGLVRPGWLNNILRNSKGFDNNEDYTEQQHYAIVIAYITELAIKIFQDELYQLSRVGFGDYQTWLSDNYPKLKEIEIRGNIRDNYSENNELSNIFASYKNQYITTPGVRSLPLGVYITNIKYFKLELNNLFGSSEQAVYKKLYEQIDSSEINKNLNQNLILFGVLKSITDSDTNYNKTKITESGYNIQDFKTIGDAKTLSFAYENKYMFNLNLPMTLQEELNTNNITDSPYIVSTSIPSISLDSIEAKLNNRIVKSLGSMRHDTFGMSFRDTPNRDYYKMFLSWFNLCYYKKGSNWRNNIRLYNYPSEYKTTMKIGLLYNYLINHSETKTINGELKYSYGVYNNPNISKDIISTSVVDYTLTKEGFYEKLDSTIENVKKSSTTKNNQYTNLKESGATIEENETVRQFPIIIEFTHLYPTNIGDLQMQSTSTELLTFDVTFEYSNPIKYWIMNLDGFYSLYEL